MNRFSSIFFILGLALFEPASAHDPIHTYNQVSFDVSAEADITNDQLAIQMTALEKGRDLETLAEKVNKTMAWALKEAGKQEQIKSQTLNYQTQPSYTKGKQTGWQVSQSLSLKSASVDELSELIGKLQTRMQLQSATYQVTREKRKQLKDKLTTQVLLRHRGIKRYVTKGAFS